HDLSRLSSPTRRSSDLVIDVSKKQAQALHSAIMKNEKRIDTFAFELAKEGEGTSTTVSITPMLDDMSKEQEKHFHDAPKDFDTRSEEHTSELQSRFDLV